MTITTKTNGYTISEELKTMVERFEYAASVLFPDWECEHFYYGDKVVMTEIKGNGCESAEFVIRKNRVSLEGRILSKKRYELCEALTHNDECHPNGRLLKLVNF